jgi:hypothetical protein
MPEVKHNSVLCAETAGSDAEVGKGAITGFVAELEHQCLYKHAPTGRQAAQYFTYDGFGHDASRTVRCGKSRPGGGGSHRVGALHHAPGGESSKVRGLASLTGIILVPRPIRRMPFWEQPAPALADWRNPERGRARWYDARAIAG